MSRNTRKDNGRAPSIIPEIIDIILGPPPTLNTEATVSHELTMEAFAQAVKPRDFIEWEYVRDCADYWTEINLLRRLKPRIIHRVKEDLLDATLEKLAFDGSPETPEISRDCRCCARRQNQSDQRRAGRSEGQN